MVQKASGGFTCCRWSNFSASRFCTMRMLSLRVKGFVVSNFSLLLPLLPLSVGLVEAVRLAAADNNTQHGDTARVGLSGCPQSRVRIILFIFATSVGLDLGSDVAGRRLDRQGQVMIVSLYQGHRLAR